MDLANAFRLGGWGMWPTLIIGVLLIGVATLYAFKPERRFVPLLWTFGLMTTISGFLGFTMGLINSLFASGQVGPDKRYIVLIGLAESAYNIVFALVLVMLAAIAAAVGAVRLARLAGPRLPAAEPR
jgi:hypothetical protein